MRSEERVSGWDVGLYAPHLLKVVEGYKLKITDYKTISIVQLEQ